MLDDPEAGPLVLERDLGIVWWHDGDELVRCGYVEDRDACPEGLEGPWSELLDWWRASGEYTRACRATSEGAWWGRFAGAAFGE